MDATNPGHSLISLGVPFLFALISFMFGLYRFKIQRSDSLILIFLNLVFLIFTFNTKIFLLNIFILSLLVWSLAAPFLSRFKAILPATVILAVFLAFIIPLYKLPLPLLPFLYLPFFTFGYMLENLEIKRNRMTTLYSLIGILISLALLYNTFHRSLKLSIPYGKVYIQSLFANSGDYVFTPIIVISFILLVFSILIPLTGMFDCRAFKNNNHINWRASFLSASLLLPFLLGITNLHPGRIIKFVLIPFLVILYLVVYLITDRRHRRSGLPKNSVFEALTGASEEITASQENSIPPVPIVINGLMFRYLSSICYIMATVLTIEYVIRNNSIWQLLSYSSTPSFAYNLILVGIVYLLVTSLLGSRLGTLLAAHVHIFLLLANYLKLKFFSEPFFPWDLGLVKDAAAISGEYISIYTIAIAAVVLLAGIILIIMNLRKIMKLLKPKPNFAFAIILVIPLVFNLNLLGSGGLKPINVFRGWYDGINEYVKNGTYVENILYLQNINKYINSKPSGYSAETVNKLKDSYASPIKTSEVKPDIIVILGETFWNPENLSNVTFNKEIAANLKKYQSGTMISPAFGGGTANVEFEVLTGFSNFFFNQSNIPYNIYFKHNMPGIVSAFKDSGYAAVALHPNDGDFYNRNKVYKYLGFDEFKDIKSLDQPGAYKGNYLSDDKLVDDIAGELKEKEQPAFILGITMQNHDPYNSNNKNYGAGREIQVKSEKLDDGEKDVLANFAQGVYDEDKALGKLIKVAKSNDRPTLIIVFGDHLPRLGVGLPGGNYDIYDKLGFTDAGTDPRSDKKFYELPYVAWSSYKDLPKLDTPITPNQLAIEILKDSGINYPSYFNSLLELRKTHPYLSSYLDSKDELSNEKAIQDYYMMQYDIMFGKQYLIGK